MRKIIIYKLIILFLSSCFQTSVENHKSTNLDTLLIEKNIKTDTVITNQKGNQDIGKALGYIKDILNYNGNYYITIDYVEWLTDSNAIKAAIEDGVIDTTKELRIKGDLLYECCPNGYYIRNRNKKIRKFLLDKDIKICIQKYGYSFNEETKLDTFISKYFSGNCYKNAPYHIEIRDSMVTKIIQKYVP